MRRERPVLHVRKGLDILAHHDIRNRHIFRPLQGMLRGVIPDFFQRLTKLPYNSPIEFEFDGKLITIIIEDLPDGD